MRLLGPMMDDAIIVPQSLHDPHAAALREELREPLVGSSNLTGSANLLIMPSLDAANISYNLLRVLSGGVSVGPMLLGLRKTAHILQDSVTTRGILNMTAIAVVDAQSDDNPELPFGE